MRGAEFVDSPCVVPFCAALLAALSAFANSFADFGFAVVGVEVEVVVEVVD